MRLDVGAGAGKEGRELQVGQNLQGEAWGGTKMRFLYRDRGWCGWKIPGALVLGMRKMKGAAGWEMELWERTGRVGGLQGQDSTAPAWPGTPRDEEPTAPWAAPDPGVPAARSQSIPRSQFAPLFCPSPTPQEFPLPIFGLFLTPGTSGSVGPCSFFPPCHNHRGQTPKPKPQSDSNSLCV